MKYFELICTAYIKKEIPFKESFEIVSKYISFSMAQDESLKSLHYKENVFKYYTFGNFYPIERKDLQKRRKLHFFSSLFR